MLVAALWAGDAAISLLVQHSRLRTKLTARLESAFGRPVQVGSYGFSIWDGPVLEADSVKIGEDPRFGNEYFLRADSISVGLHWLSLLRGHVSLGTLSLNHPSLNLVRDAGGEWNVEEWLPRPATGVPSSAPGANLGGNSSPLQFRRIEISDGRIDFKRGYEKLAFAFVGVNGTVETDAPGRWHIELTASPWRAAVLTQRPGVIRVNGHIGGTSSRLRPAALEISWKDASIADFFRLLHGDDYGIRGKLAVSISAHTEPQEPVNGWVLQGKAELSGLHRWDLAARPDNPSLNIVANQVLLDPNFSEARVVDARIETRHSSASATASLNWTGGRAEGGLAIGSSDFVDVTSSQVDLGDVLDWVRAFHPGVADKTSVHGMTDVRAHFSGWPPTLVRASVTGQSADLIAPGLRGPEHIGPVELRYNRGAISLRPVTFSWGTRADDSAASFQIDASPNRRLAMFPSWHVAGSAADMGDITAMAAAFGLNISLGWDLQGPVSCDLRWTRAPFPWEAKPVGTISIGEQDAKSGGASLRTPFLNLPIGQIHARVELDPSVRKITLSLAQAFGTKWNGTFERKSADAEWHFALAAGKLSAVDLDRWLDPRWRESFLDRMLPFLGPSASSASPEDLLASGRLQLGEFALEPLTIRHLQGDLKIHGRDIDFSDAQGQFYGGEVSGLLRANLSTTPNYHAEVAFSGVDGAALAAASPKIVGLRAKSAGGRLSIDAKGSARGDLIASLACRGAMRATGLELLGANLENALDPLPHAAATAPIPEASAAFTCSKRAIQFQRISLVLGEGQALAGSGSVVFDRSLDLLLHDVSDAASARPGSSIRITGYLSSPQISKLVAPATRR
ncbi:MAG: hypothetical protein ACRD4R_13825 [Candidatus Acidiferrales bacterium]